MHPFLVVVGGALIAYSQALGHTLAAGICAVVGGLLTSLSKRAQIPVLRALPQFAPAGSAAAFVISVVVFVVGSTAIGLPTEYDIKNDALRIFLPVLGWFMLAGFSTEDLSKDKNASPPTAAMALLLIGLATPSMDCAHVTPVASCVEEKLGPRGPAVMAEVVNDLDQQNWSELLLDLGPTLGWSVLTCVLDDVEHTNPDPVKVQRVKLFKKQQAAKLHG